jgi:hypothetical protein
MAYVNKFIPMHVGTYVFTLATVHPGRTSRSLFERFDLDMWYTRPGSGFKSNIHEFKKFKGLGSLDFSLLAEVLLGESDQYV